MSPAADFKPSQVDLAAPPLVGTLGHAEMEFAAAMIVRACQVHGDAWQAVSWDQIQSAMYADMTAERPPFAALMRNPFFQPDVHELVAKGFARWTGEPAGRAPVELLPPAFEKMLSWVRR